ncbi:DUF6542 domain-containing protein [Nocardia vermiculata]|uniref:DUF6542 domain-containing protein n=1 Tax=Nocardia vermiculata TaxID=257274 RepID=UPI000A037ACE|nr:DUF6542 domain-containing protein [Nocardia vermiculata]
MAATQRERSDVPASHLSIIPTVPGVPAGAAVLIAVACTFIGFFFDSGNSGKELTHVFAAFYIIGCLIAACVVRYRGLFTTMVAPPILLFVGVPMAYWQLTGHSSTSVKDILLNLAIPLVNRFPTMALATVLVLLVGALRVWLYRNGDSAPRPARERRRASDSWNPRAAMAARTRRGAGDTAAADTLRRNSRDRKRRPETAARAETAKRAATTKRAEGAKRAQAAKRGGARKPQRAAPPEAEPGRPARRSGKPAAERPQKVPAGAPHPRTTDRATPERRRAAAAEPKPRRGRPQPQGDVPPHPRPNVRYRDRDSGRVER